MWRLGHARSLALRPIPVIAILNLTTDSFYAGSRVGELGGLLESARQFAAEGAAMLDLGAESTRPGASRVPAREQAERLIPAIRAIRQGPPEIRELPISVDTTCAAVADAALDAGADAVNDVSGATEDPEMLDVVARHQAGIILMHRLVPPETDRYSDQYARSPTYVDVVAEVRAFLVSQARAALAAGISKEAIVIDPGLGFGKSVEQNLELIKRTGELASEGYAVLSALSRKSFIGRVALGRDSTPDERLAGTLAASIEHVRNGARLVRVHDVAPHVQALAMLAGLSGLNAPPPTGRALD
ncbi:MAG: dihydropteroate synthase [Phycisphaeraceae bacterium]|nr:dihydropteroate synthase [Phycisphaeraceae bacterium]